MRMEQRLLDEMSHMRIVDRIEEPVTGAANIDDMSKTKLGQMLRDRCRLYTNVIRHLADRVLAMQKGPKDSQTCVVTEHLERLHRHRELVVTRCLKHMRIHAGSVAAVDLVH